MGSYIAFQAMSTALSALLNAHLFGVLLVLVLQAGVLHYMVLPLLQYFWDLFASCCLESGQHSAWQRVVTDHRPPDCGLCSLSADKKMYPFVFALDAIPEGTSALRGTACCLRCWFALISSMAPMTRQGRI